MKQLNSQSADLLREVVNIGASQSSAVLAARLGVPVRVSVPQLREVALWEAAEVLGPPEQPVEALLSLFDGDFRGGVLLSLSEKDARDLRAAAGISGGVVDSGEDVLTGVLEAFVSSTSMFLQVELRPDISRRLRDMAGALLPSLVGELDYEVDVLWVAEVAMLPERGRQIVGRLFFIGDDAFHDLLDDLAR